MNSLPHPGLSRPATPSSQETGAAFSDRLRHHLGAARAAARVPEDPETVALWEHLEREARTGKRLRPRLLLHAVRLLETDPTGRAAVDREALLDAACGVELLHQAFLLHDDVIDEDLRRRGQPNVYGAFTERARHGGAAPVQARGYGRCAAILAGDLLLAQAHQALARLEVPRPVLLSVLDALASAVTDSAAGELADAWLGLGPHALPDSGSTALRPRPGDEARVLRVLDQKTAAYSFRMPLVLAGILSGRPPEQVEDLARAGTYLGLVYQIRDDVLGTFGDPARTGKSATADLREGKLTLLVLGARTHPDWEAAAGAFGTGELTEEQAEGLRAVIRRSGALDRAGELAREHRALMGRDLAASTLPPTLVRDLLELADYAQERNS